MDSILSRAIKSYTRGRYGFFVEYAIGMAEGDDSICKHACKYHISYDENIGERIEDANALIQALDMSVPGLFSKTYRVESWNGFNPNSSLTVGDEVTWHMKSASYDACFIQKINDNKDEYIQFKDKYGDDTPMIAFEIEGSYKALDLSAESDFDQHEVLIKGTFNVDSVEDVWMPVENGFPRHVRKIRLMAI